jgi:drug/metabolite transporter (DMT)-like permease
MELSLPDTGWLVTMGVIAVTSIGLLAAATTQGALSIVSVLAATFPVTTILLARLVLGERLGAVQRVGAVVALAGVALIAL